MSAERGLLRSPVGDCQPPGVPAPQHDCGGHKDGERPGEFLAHRPLWILGEFLEPRAPR